MAEWLSISGRAAAALLGLLLLFPASAEDELLPFGASTFTLENGMQAVVVPDNRAPVVMHQVWYKAGATDEPEGAAGIAHFFEHLMFKGTETVPPKEFSRIVARRGGRDNASTSWDYTNYWQLIAAEHLERMMQLEADRMVNLTLAEKDVLTERNVIIEERTSRIDNQPFWRLDEQMNAALYGPDHAYSVAIIGPRSEIEQLNRDDALAFYERYYAPNNAVLIVAGDVTVDQVRTLAEKYYGPIPSREVDDRLPLGEITVEGPHRLSLADASVSRARFSRSYLAPSLATEGVEQIYALEVLSQILGGTTTSRLYTALVREQKIADGASTSYWALRRGHATFDISAQPAAERSLEELEAAIEAELQKVIEGGITEDELRRAKTQLVADELYAYDSVYLKALVSGLMVTNGFPLSTIATWTDNIEAVTAAQVQAAAANLFDPAKSATGWLLPEAAQ